jgi:integrase/recombinase XerD
MSFENYLNEHYAPATAARYQRETEDFFLSIETCSSTPLRAQEANYQDIMNWIEQQRKRYQSSSAVACSLYAVKAWYTWLAKTNQIEHNPAQAIYLKDKRHQDIQLQDLLTSQELLQLLNRKERYPALKTRNQAIIGLMIFQALRPIEITQLKPQDINLQNATIHINASRTTNSRTLQLQPQQILNLHQASPPYNIKIDAIAHLITSQQSRINVRDNKKLNPTTVRQSVIAGWLKARTDLRKAQYMAGHKYPSTTERYRQTGVEELKAAVMKYHPLQ